MGRTMCTGTSRRALRLVCKISAGALHPRSPEKLVRDDTRRNAGKFHLTASGSYH